MIRRGVIPAMLFALLAACEGREAAFCERFVRSSLERGQSYERVSVTIRDKQLMPLEAQRLVYPNFHPNAAFPRRPGNATFILDALATYPASLREVTLAFRARGDETGQPIERTCQFLRLADSTQFTTRRDLGRLLIKRALAAEEGRATRCCIRQNEMVR